MKQSLTVVAFGSLLMSGCSTKKDAPTVGSTAGIDSVHTALGAGCKQEVDHDDPNETPYLVCPGVAGYALIVRHVDAGRASTRATHPPWSR